MIAVLEAQGVLDRAKVEGVETALATCRCIGAAMGVLMAAHKLTEDAAFDQLRKASQASHRKLRDIADDVLVTGTLE